MNIEAGRNERICLVADVARAENVITITGERVPRAEPRTRRVRSRWRQDGGLKLPKGRPPGFPGPRKRGVSGPVVLLFAIRTDGAIADAIVLDSCDAELEKISVDAVTRWRYAPMKLDGTPVDSHQILKFDFTY